jgi:cyanuric acid amidohydrolase
MQKVEVFRIPTASPDDVSGLKNLIENGSVDPRDIIAVLGKTEGNGCVNDFTRGFATQSLSIFMAEQLDMSVSAVQERIAFVMSGGTEGVMSPHLTVFTRKEVDQPAKEGKRLAAGIAFTRDFLPEEIGRMAGKKSLKGAYCDERCWHYRSAGCSFCANQVSFTDGRSY